MNILTFAASNSRNSINKALVQHASGLLPDTAKVDLVDLNDFEMPIYSVDREAETGIPQEAKDFYAAIGAADGIIVSFAEHNGTVTAAWKNLFDWMSRIDMKVWQNKPVLMLATSPGPNGGAYVLEGQKTTAPFFGANVTGSYGIGSWFDVWDGETANITSPEHGAALDAAVAEFVAAVAN